MPETRLRTVGDFLDHRYKILLFCNCGYTAYLDLQKLAETEGRDFDLYDGELEKRLECSSCGRRGPATIVEPPNRDKSMWSRL